jgi:8-oxo-dGTP diphosphatase
VIGYVLGFAFDGEWVLLLQKQRPAWQAGKLNGIGGKIEPGEAPLDAMRREFFEETGVVSADWTPVAVIDGGGYTLHVFASYDTPLQLARTVTDEELTQLSVHQLEAAERCDMPQIPNVRWLVAMARMFQHTRGAPYRIGGGPLP